MQVKTTGIVIHSIKYSDSSTIVTVYTRQFGRVSYMVHGVNKKRSVFRAAFLQPLSILELDVIHSPGKEIQRIKDIQLEHPFIDIPYNPVKNALALFLSEMLFSLTIQSKMHWRYFYRKCFSELYVKLNRMTTYFFFLKIRLSNLISVKKEFQTFISFFCLN